MSENVLTLAPGDRPLNQSLGFGARSVVVDNLTASYVQLPDTGKSVPPWVYGAVVSLPLGINRARASLLATVPAVPGPPVPPSLAVCTMTWTDVALAPSPGHLLQQSVGPRAWDWFVNKQCNPADVSPAVTQAGSAGVSLVVARLSCSFVGGTGNGQSAIVGCTETAAPSRVLWGDIIGVPSTANAIDHFDKPDLLLLATKGVGVQFQIQGLTLAAGNFAYLNMAGYNE